MQSTTDPGRTRARRLPAEERRRQILEASVGVFARLGYSGTGTADIAAAAGIGEPTIYRYFANKRELYIEAIRQGADEIWGEWERMASEATDALTALSQIGIWYYRQMQGRPELLLLRSRSATEAPDAEVLGIVRAEYRRVVAFVESLFARAKAEGQLAPDADVRTLTWVFMAVGSLLDQARILQLDDDLGPGEVARLAALLQAASVTHAGT